MSAPNYVESTYRQLEKMGFKPYNLTYAWDENGEFVTSYMAGYEGNMECVECIAPWENFDIIKALWCNDYGMPNDEVYILEKIKLTMDEAADFSGSSLDSKINYIKENDPYYDTLGVEAKNEKIN